MSQEMREALEAIAKGSFPGASNAVLDGTFSAKLQEIARKALSTPPRLDPHTVEVCADRIYELIEASRRYGESDLVYRAYERCLWEVRALLTAPEQSGEARAVLPVFRCSNCDNAVEVEWKFCAWCGSVKDCWKHPEWRVGTSTQATLSKRPVAFRIKRADPSTGETISETAWRYFTDEAEAVAAANDLGIDYQGLYVRDGSPQPQAGDGVRAVLERCRTILGNMAKENETLRDQFSYGSRWPISHEPLRADAKNLLPEIDRALAASPSPPKMGEEELMHIISATASECGSFILPGDLSLTIARAVLSLVNGER